MQPSRFSSLLLLLLGLMIIAGTAVIVAQSGPANFGINENQLKPRLAGALTYGQVPIYPNSKQFHAATPAARVAFVKNTLTWIKAYTETSAFKAEYDKQREANKPTPPESKGTPDEQFAKQLAEQRKGIEEMKQNLAKMPPDMQKQMAETIKQMEANVEHTAKDPQMSAMMKQGYAQQAESEQKTYREELADYQKKYPPDAKVLIASRLREFLTLSRDVDFSARLVPADGGKMKFADPRYEAKPDLWKLCYRAGREPVEAARAFAAEWMQQVEKK